MSVRAGRLGLAALVLAWAYVARAQTPDAAATPARAAQDDVKASPEYEGEAAPPTAAGTTRHNVEVRPGLEVFAEYAYRRTLHRAAPSSWYHAFDVPRIHLALDAEVDAVHGRVLFEAVRSAAEGALVGVAGDSLVIRAREAYAGYRYEFLDGAAGLIPTLALPELEGTWMLRAVSPSPQESTGLLAPSDVGVRLRGTLPAKYGYVAVAGFNGEGYNQRELNRGKNLEAATTIHPLPAGPLLPLGVFAAYQMGSTGTALARSDRLTGGLLWQGTKLRAGATVSYGWGLDDDGSRRTLLADGFVRLGPFYRFLFGLRAYHWIRNTDSDAGRDTLSAVTGAVGYEVAEPLQTFLVGARSVTSRVAETALTGSNHWEARWVTRVVF